MIEELKGRLGPEEFARRVEDGHDALVNVHPEDLEDLEQQDGTRGFLEAAFELGRNPRSAYLDASSTLTALEALAELERLKGDPEFMALVRRSEVTATDRWKVLHEQAYPEGLDTPDRVEVVDGVEQTVAKQRIEELKVDPEYIEGTNHSDHTVREPWTKKMAALMRTAYPERR